MRVLLIDNHDSFTWNLAHDLAAVTGRMPVVVPNDAPVSGPVEDWMGSFDAIVVSPGPGTPETPADLGLSLAAVEQGQVPVLGVCLGMQAIGHAAGIPVVRAPRPVHGEVASIRHTGGGVFAGLPDPLPMVRYHSLVLDLGTEGDHRDIAVDAWCDGLVMGIHHRTRPQWGVQTHPESICSDSGRRLFTTFLDLAAAWNEAAGRTVPAEEPVSLDVPERRGTAGESSVLVRRIDGTFSGEAMFDALVRGDDHAWWLDSASGGGFSACGSAAGPTARVATGVDGRTRVRDADGVREVDADLLVVVEDSLGTVTCVDLAGAVVAQPPFLPGWVGYLGYEFACAQLPGRGRCLASNSLEVDTPEAEMVFSDRVVVTTPEAVWLVALTRPDVDAEQRAWIERSTDVVRRASDLAEPPGVPRTGAVSLRHDRAAYLRLIERCQEEIAAGESYELCLTNRVTVETTADPWTLYRRLRRLAPRPFAAYLAFDDGQVLSASPERFLSVDAAGVAEAKPIKGTRPRGATPDQDARLAAELTESVKERAENLMIVDLLRHDLSRICTPGSVHVPLLFDVETHAGVHQLVSTIRGTLAPGHGPIAAVRAALPGGSMTGAPKERSVRILRDLEGAPRGVYSGVVGYVSVTGVTDLSIVIRTLVHHGDHVTYGVGGAITARSEAVEEWEETLVKARTLGATLGLDLDVLLDLEAQP